MENHFSDNKNIPQYWGSPHWKHVYAFHNIAGKICDQEIKIDNRPKMYQEKKRLDYRTSKNVLRKQ